MGQISRFLLKVIVAGNGHVTDPDSLFILVLSCTVS